MKMRTLTQDEYHHILRKNTARIYQSNVHLERVELYLLITMGTNYQEVWVTHYLESLKADIRARCKL